MVSREPPLRKRRAENRRLHVLDTALAIFARRGFAETTVKDITNAAGISNGSLYSYFLSKDQLLEAIAEQYNFLPQLQLIYQCAKGQSYHKSSKNITSGFIRVFEQRNKIIVILLRESASNTKVREILSNLLHECVSILQKYMSDHTRTSELRYHNTEIIARCLLSSMIMFHITKGFFKPSNITKSKFINEMLDNLLQGIQNTGC